MATGRSQGQGFGTNVSMVAAGGQTTSAAYVGAAEEWGFAPPTAAILTEGSIFLSAGTTLKGFGKAAGIPSTSWASGGSLNAGRYRVSASNTGGTVSASIIFGGYAPS
jgi:hypothetical protein